MPSNELAALINDSVKSAITSKVTDQHTAQDLLQELYIKADQQQSKLVAADNSTAYLYRMASNLVTDHFRKQARMHHHETAHQVDDQTTDELHRLIAEHCVKGFVDLLPPKYAEAVRLVDLEGMAQVELAAHLGISHAGAKSRVQRGRRLLRQKLESCCDFTTDVYGQVLDMQLKQ